jgi:hypothetical protein
MKNVIAFPFPSGPHARLTDPDTSHDAVPSKENMTRQMLRVLRVYASGEHLLDHDIEARLPGGWHQRCTNLRKPIKYIARDGKALSPSGKPSYLCVITEEGRDLLGYIDCVERRKVKPMRQKTELRSYQKRVVDHLYECPEAMAVLKMGAGKTISTLTAIADLIHDEVIRHALVIAPKRVATIVWPEEIKSWEHTKDLSYAVLDGAPLRRMGWLHLARLRQITIVGIDNVQWLVKEIENWPADHPIWDCLVIDETSRLKDPKSKRARVLAKIAGRFKNRWGLTGTPMPNSLLDLFNPVKVITDGRLWGKSFDKWRKEHFYPTDYKGYTWAVKDNHTAQILADAGSITIALGENEMPELPPISVLVEEVDLPDDARLKYRGMEVKLLTQLDGTDVLAKSQAIATGKLAQMANGFLYGDEGAVDTHPLHDEKADWLTTLVKDLNGEPVIVVYEYQADLALIRKLFGDVPYLGSGVSDKQAQQFVDDWNAGKTPILALHPKSGGHGLNLQDGGSRMAWLAPTWSAESWDQTIARIYRPGQTAAHVMVHVCVARSTVDDLKRLRVIEKLSGQVAFERYLASVTRSVAA